MEIAVYLTIVVLAGLNICQYLFWSRQVNQLLNKLMSRNYAEYVSIEKEIASPPQVKMDLDPAIDEEKEILSELNGMLA
jgi:hypothetical protein